LPASKVVDLSAHDGGVPGEKRWNVAVHDDPCTISKESDENEFWIVLIGHDVPFGLRSCRGAVCLSNSTFRARPLERSILLAEQYD